MLKEYEAEINLLKELGYEFASRYPEHASSLSFLHGNISDPNIERLIESVAFLNAGLRQKLNTSFSDLSLGLLEQYCPSLLQPYPACTVLKFFLQDYSLKGTFKFNKDNYIQTLDKYNKHTEEVNFSFPFDLDIHPIAIKQQNIIQADNNCFLAKIEISPITGANLEEININKLLLYISGPTNNSLNLSYYIHSTDLVTASIKQNNNIDTEIATKIDNNIFYHMLNENNAGIPVYYLLDHFYFPEKNCFICLDFKDKVIFQSHDDVLHLEFKFNAETNIEYFALNNFNVNAFPAANIWPSSSETINCDNYSYEYPINTNNKEYILNSVKSVKVFDRDGNLEELNSVNNPQSNLNDSIRAKNQRESLSYNIQKKYLNNSEFLSYLSLHGSNNNLTNLYAICDLYISNNSTTIQKLNQTKYKGASSLLPDGIDVNNINAISKLISPPFLNHYSENLLLSITSNFNTMTNVKSLKNFLHAIIWDKNLYIYKIVNSIVKIDVYNGYRLSKGTIIKSIDYCLYLDIEVDGKYSLIYFFGKNFLELLKTKIAVSSEINFKIIQLPKTKEYNYKTYSGSKYFV